MRAFLTAAGATRWLAHIACATLTIALSFCKFRCAELSINHPREQPNVGSTTATSGGCAIKSAGFECLGLCLLVTVAYALVADDLGETMPGAAAAADAAVSQRQRRRRTNHSLSLSHKLTTSPVSLHVANHAPSQTNCRPFS